MLAMRLLILLVFLVYIKRTVDIQLWTTQEELSDQNEASKASFWSLL